MPKSTLGVLHCVLPAVRGLFVIALDAGDGAHLAVTTLDVGVGAHVEWVGTHVVTILHLGIWRQPSLWALSINHLPRWPFFIFFAPSVPLPKARTGFIACTGFHRFFYLSLRSIPLPCTASGSHPIPFEGPR